MVHQSKIIWELHRAIGALLREHREEAGLSQGDVARAVQYSRPYVNHAETGRWFPRNRSFWEKVDSILGAAGKLVEQYDHIDDEMYRFEVSQLTEKRAPRLQGAPKDAQKHCGRRELVGGQIDSPEDRRPTLRNPRNVDFTAVAQIRDEVQRIGARYDRAPSSALIAESGHCLAQVEFLRAQVVSSKVRRELVNVESETHILMGQLVWDASQRRDHAGARKHFKKAIGAARHVRDPIAEGAALLRTSYVALYGEKDPKEGLRLTRQSKRVAGTSSNVIAGLAELHSAEAHAMLGERKDCERALSTAAGHFDEMNSEDPLAELYSPSQHGRLSGSCYLSLRDVKRAQVALLDTEKLLRGKSKSRAIVLGNLSLAYIGQRELEPAVAALHSAIDVVESTWGGGGLNVIFTAAAELRRWRQVEAVQGVNDRLLSLMAAR